MIKFFSALCSIALLSVSVTLLAETYPEFSPTTAQAYQQSTEASGVADNSDDEQAMQQVEAVMQQSRQKQAMLKEGGLQQQLTQINQANLLFQQQTNQQIEALTQKNQQLQADIKQLVLITEQLNQQLKLLQQAAQPDDSSAVSWPHWLMRWRVHEVVVVLLGVVVFLLVVIALLLVSRRTGKKKALSAVSNVNTCVKQAASHSPTSSDVDDDSRAEYDFMNSQEGIAAKLDLARSYLAMGDDEAARQVLAQVEIAGSPAQQQEARRLLTSLDQNKSTS